MGVYPVTSDTATDHGQRTWLPPWLLVVQVVAVLAGVVVTLAAIDVIRTGIVRPWVAGLGILVTVFVNRVYVVVSRRGRVFEGIDIAEAPVVALALLLPPGEAVLTFVAASVLLEMHFPRARVKKVFNVGVRAVGAALVVLPVAIHGYRPAPGLLEGTLVIAGAVAYTVFTAVAIALVVASVQEQRVRSVLRADLSARVLVWGMATTLGVAGAHIALRAPAALVGILAPLVLVWITAHAVDKSARETDRLRRLLDASTRIQQSEDVSHQEQVLVDAARDLLLWKDVEVRDRPPTLDERGRQLYAHDGAERWLVIARQAGSDPWLPDDDNVVDFLARSATAAFERSSFQEDLARQALLDPLTGVANRRHFDHEVGRLAAGKRGYGLVLCDLDHFKTVNDRLGHDAGDELLRIAAARLASSVRSGDLIARLGGDEFVVLLPGVTSREALQRVRETITVKFEQRVKVGRWQLSSLPCSLGVAAAPRDGRSPREVLRAADESMYDAKRVRKSARHRITVTLPDAPTVDLTSDTTARPMLRIARLRPTDEGADVTGTDGG